MASTHSALRSGILLLLVLAGGVQLLRMASSRDPDRSPSRDADAVSPTSPCSEGAGADCRTGADRAVPRGSGPVLPASEACLNVGYLCSDLSRGDTLRIVRFADRTAELTVRVPRPGGEDPEATRELQRAAVRGIQTWQGHPFPIRILERDRGEPADVRIEWTDRIDGSALGRTRSRYRTGAADPEYRIVGMTLATRIPVRGADPLPPKQVQLAAAHEMGHALGLPHSDEPRDLMYPTNTATRPTARDYRTLESLYRLPAGARITRPP